LSARRKIGYPAKASRFDDLGLGNQLSVADRAKKIDRLPIDLSIWPAQFAISFAVDWHESCGTFDLFSATG
jgi:hypothetical protein